MPLILQIETSTEICSVALSKNGQLLYSVESDDPNSHTEKLTLLIQTCMVQTGFSFKQLDAIALSDGPGSYTSLRIGAATAKGICYAMDIPLLTFNSLTILANGIDTLLIGSDDIILPMIDARRMEVYTAVYDKQLKQLEEIQPLILDTQSFTNYTQIKHLCGNGAEKFITNFPDDRLKLHFQRTSATFMTALSFQSFQNKVFSDVAYFTPEYYKGPNITKSTKKIF